LVKRIFFSVIFRSLTSCLAKAKIFLTVQPYRPKKVVFLKARCIAFQCRL